MVRIKYKEALDMEVKRGRPAIGKKPTKKELQRLYIKELRSIRDVAKILGCSKDMVYRSLKEYGIKRVKRIRRNKVSNITVDYLERELRTKSKRQVTKDLGVSLATLYNYLSRLKTR